MTTQNSLWNVTSTSSGTTPNVTVSPRSNLTLTELNDQVALTLLPAIIVVAALMALGILGNGVVVYIFCRKMPKGTQNFLVLCLAIFDLLSCTVVMPTEIVDMREFYMFQSENACKMLRFVNVFTAISSIFTLLVIAWDRYKNVLRPFQRQMSLRSAQRSIALVLVSSLLLSWPAFFLYGIHHVDVGIPDEFGRDCSTADAMRGTIYPLIYNAVQFLGFVIITIVLIVMYVRILRETRRHYKYLRSTSDFYYGTGSVARPEFSRNIALISDSRINLNEYFTKEMDERRSSSYLHGGVDNAAFSLHESENTQDRKRGEKSPQGRTMTSPVVLRRFKGGRNNAKYFISSENENNVFDDYLTQGSRWKKSASTPDFDKLVFKASNSSRDVRSEGKPTPVQPKRFLNRQISVNNSDKHSVNGNKSGSILQSLDRKLSDSDDEITRNATGTHDYQLVRMCSDHAILCHNGVGIAMGGQQGRRSNIVHHKSLRRDREFQNKADSDAGLDKEDSLKSNLSSQSSTIINRHVQHTRLPSMTGSSHFPILSHSEPATPYSSSLSSSHKLGKQNSSWSNLLVDSRQSEREAKQPLGAAPFFLPQYDEGIDMSFEIEDDHSDKSTLTLALCPNCQSQFVQRAGSQNSKMEDLKYVDNVSKFGSLGENSEQGSPSQIRHVTGEQPSTGEVLSHEKAQKTLNPSPHAENDTGQYVIVHNDSECSLPPDCVNAVEVPNDSTRPHEDDDPTETPQEHGYRNENSQLMESGTCSCQKPNKLDVKTQERSDKTSLKDEPNHFPIDAKNLSDRKRQRRRVKSESIYADNAGRAALVLNTVHSDPDISAAINTLSSPKPTGGNRKRPFVRAKSESASFYKTALKNSFTASDKRISFDTRSLTCSINDTCHSPQGTNGISLSCDGTDLMADKCSVCSLPKVQSRINRQQECTHTDDGKPSSTTDSKVLNSNPESKIDKQFSPNRCGHRQIPSRTLRRYPRSNYDWMTPPSTPSSKHEPEPKPSSATSIALCVTSVFILSFLPHLCLMLSRVLKPNFDQNLTGSDLVLFNIFLRSYLANSALNPFVYGWLNQQFRHHCCQILRIHCSCCSR